MSKTYANANVLEFYQKLPFNYFGDVDAAVKSIINTNIREYIHAYNHR